MPDVLKPSSTITVEPSDALFQELGNNTYDYKDLLSELIDNCIAARYPNELLRVNIDLIVNEQQEPIEFIIFDSAQGISKDKLALAITPAGIRSVQSLNEHGLGMKQAVAGLGTLNHLTTKTKDEKNAKQIRRFKFGLIEVYEQPFDRPSGTTISITHLKDIVVTAPATITRTIVPYLGARYRRFLKPDNPVLALRIQIRQLGKPDALYTWDVREVKPTYFHPGTRENRPVIQSFPLEGAGWSAELTFGYAPKDQSEYEELGLEIPVKTHPYHVSIGKQGLDILLHDRVILFHQLAEAGLVNQRHSDYNAVRGEIVLVKGFSTAITKNSIIYDQHFRECLEKVKGILSGEQEGPGKRKENYLQSKSYPDEIPEALLRDRLVEWLQNNPLQPRKSINKEYVVQGIEGFIDILADGEAWELKTDQANALDVYQLFMYMDVGDIKKGYLVAKNYSPGAKVAAEHVSKIHKREIILSEREKFPINHQPNTAEREEYY